MNIDEACEQFLAHCATERQLSVHTINAYRQDLAEFTAHRASLLIEDTRGEHLIAYAQFLAQQRKLSPATVKRRIACLKAMFKWLERRELIAESPFRRTELRVRLPARLPRCLHTGEVRTLLSGAERMSLMTRLAALLLFSTGIRVSELSALRIENVDVDQRAVRIHGKGNRERQVFIPDEAVALLLRRYIATTHGDATSGRLLLNARGRPASAACLRTRIKALARTAGLTRTVTPHMLRHTTATKLIEAGVDIRFVQRLLGHRSIATTQIYTHVSDSALKHAVTTANICRFVTGED